MNEIRSSDLNQSEKTSHSGPKGANDERFCHCDQILHLNFSPAAGIRQEGRRVLICIRIRQTDRHLVERWDLKLYVSSWSTATDLWRRFDEDVSRWRVSLNRRAGSDDWTSWQLVKLQLRAFTQTEAESERLHHIKQTSYQSWVYYWSDGDHKVSAVSLDISPPFIASIN